MELTKSGIYWIGIADNLRIAFVIGIVVCGYYLNAALEKSKVKFDERFDENDLRAVIPLFGMLALFAAFIFFPNSRTLAAMEVLPAMSKNPQVREITKHVLELTDEVLREHLAEQIKKNKKK